ncbi:MAG: AAA family ATPase [Pseudomonadota bacterium]
MYLNRIEIENLRAIRKLALDFGTASKTRRWTVLLGENGCGKSTVLKAIALVLAGSEAIAELLEDPDSWVHNDAKIAKIRAVISTAQGEQRQISLEIHRGDRRDTVIRRNQKGLAPLDAALEKANRNYFMAGYGAFRRPPDPLHSNRNSKRGARVSRANNVGTLFSASFELMSIEQWAFELDYREGSRGREVIAEALGSLLPGMSFSRIDKKEFAIWMKTQDGEVRLRNLSEGYQAMAAWAGDILYRLTETFRDWKSPLSSRGVLIIDEMDLHLHPVWKRNFVEFLNRAFPRLQIIATTHSPLSIQQCGEGELFVVKREGAGAPTLIEFKGDPSKLRLSELFLSPLIGLDTLDSPKVAALRNEARIIELSRSKQSPADIRRLDEIAQELKGTTPLPPAEVPALASVIAFQRTLSRLLPPDHAAQPKLRATPMSAAAPAKKSRKTAMPAPAKKAAAKSPTKRASVKKG